MAGENQIIISKTGSTEKPLSKLQQQFNNFIKKIEKLKGDVENTKNIIVYMNKQIATKIHTGRFQLVELHSVWLTNLDWSYDNLKLGKTDKSTLSEIIVDESEEMLFNADTKHLTELFQNIHDKHSDINFQEKKEENKEFESEMAKEMFKSHGIDLGDDKIDLEDPEFIARMRDKMKDSEEQARETNATRKKSKKEIEREEQQRLEEKDINKSVREIYTSLAKAFHPDLEQDETERDRKTEIMKRITAAKDENDLVALLRLQLEFEQIDQTKINQFADEQIKHFNKILKEQVDALNQELYMLKGGFDWEHPFQKYGGDNELMVDYRIKKEKKEIDKAANQLKRDLHKPKDLDYLKQYLKQYRKEQKEMDMFDDDDVDMNMFMEFMSKNMGKK